MITFIQSAYIIFLMMCRVNIYSTYMLSIPCCNFTIVSGKKRFQDFWFVMVLVFDAVLYFAEIYQTLCHV